MSVGFKSPEYQRFIPTIQFLCERGTFGYAALDSDYQGIWRYGTLASWIPLGENVCHGTDLFFGLEKQLLDLQDDHGACMTLPRVGVPANGDETSKMSVEIFWDNAVGMYHVVVHKLIAESEVELELLKQIRARRLAEDNFQKTREALAHRQMLLDIVMETLPVAAAIFDERRRYLFATHRWMRDFQLECEPLLGQDVFEIGNAIPEHEKQSFGACLRGLPTKPEIRSHSQEEGHVRYFRWGHSLWQQSDGTNSGVLSSAEDLSELVKQLNELRFENKELKNANQQVKNFTSIAAHDLSAPLRSISDFIDELERPNGPDINGLAEEIRKCFHRVKTILDTTYDYCHIYSDIANLEPVNIENIISNIIEALPIKERFSIECCLVESNIFINASIFDIVLRNLLDNAIKHHDKDCGRIIVAMQEDDSAWLICVEDDGPGISCHQQERLFGEPSSPGKSDLTERDGIGLVIVKRALDCIDATLRVYSDPVQRRGTKFVIRWPKHFVAAGSDP